MPKSAEERRAGYNEQARQQKHDYYLRNRERILAYGRAWRAANPEESRRQSAAWRAANPERAAELKRADYERHRPERLNAARRRHEELADSVVRSHVAHGGGKLGLTSRDVPDEVLPLFRQQLLIQRELRKQKAAP